MAIKEEGNDNLFCSFCGKNQKEVTKLIAGPATQRTEQVVITFFFDRHYLASASAILSRSSRFLIT